VCECESWGKWELDDKAKYIFARSVLLTPPRPPPPHTPSPHTDMYVCVRVCVRVLVYREIKCSTRLQSYTFVCMSVCKFVWMYVCQHVDMHVCMNVLMPACRHAHMHECIDASMHTYV